jgi:asparagine synthase (glutamine-hydrolysing)
MCGIVGIIDLSGQRRTAPRGAIQAMARAIIHRGPDEDGFLEQPGVTFGSRRLSIVGLFDGRQPIRNEDGSVAVVFNGELFDYPEKKAALEAKGHKFRTHCDTELIPHLYEDHQDKVFEQMRGQFAVALYDEKRRRVLLGRDRVGICPLFWTRQRTSEGEWLLFSSEIKGLLASGMVQAQLDPQGLNHLFTFFSMPGPVTCFQGVQALLPGTMLDIQLGSSGPARVETKRWYTLEFPEQGKEDSRPLNVLVDELNDRMLAATTRRLRADVPVVSYLSGGVDSSLVVAMASHVRGSPIPSFTIRIKAPKLDETAEAGVVARHIGTEPIVVDVGAEEVLSTYPELIRAAESPVIDTSCAALLLLAREVHRRGYKVALTGEGADEWLAGYPWHKVNRLLSQVDLFGMPISQWLRRCFVKLSGNPSFRPEIMSRAQKAVGGHNGWLDIYGLVSLSKLRFFSEETKQQTMDRVPYEDLDLPTEKMLKWHPLNRELCLSGRLHLPGLLLNAKGDRVAMNSSVEARYPFLDEDVVSFLATVPPKYKLRGLFGDKYLLRQVASRWLPKSIAWRTKAMFRAPFDSFHLDVAPPFVEQLLSAEALTKTGYFDVASVLHWRKAFRNLGAGSLSRISVEMGLVGVLSTQLWHHTFVDGALADLPTLVQPKLSPETSSGNSPVVISSVPERPGASVA